MADETNMNENDDGLYPDSDLFNKEEYSDFKVKCEETVFHMMKLSLSSASVVFRKMFSTPTYKECQDAELEIKDVQPDAVEAFLKYAYNKKPIQGFTVAKQVIELAEQYQMGKLKGMCESVLIDGITSEGLLDLLHFADRFKLVRLQKACHVFGYKHASTLPAFKARFPISKPSTVCIARNSDYVLFDPPVWFCAEADPNHEVVCFLKPGKELIRDEIQVQVDLYKYEGNEKFSCYNYKYLIAKRIS